MILQEYTAPREHHPPLRRSMIIVGHIMWYLVRLCMALSRAGEVDSLGRDAEHERNMRRWKAAPRRCTPLQPSPYEPLCDSA